MDYFDGPGYAAWIMGGESKDPEAVCRELKAEIRRLAREKIPEEDFLAARNAVYGCLTAQLNSVESCGDWMASGHFYGRNPFELIDAAAGLDIQSVYVRLERDFREEASCLSIVRPQADAPQ